MKTNFKLMKILSFIFTLFFMHYPQKGALSLEDENPILLRENHFCKYDDLKGIEDTRTPCPPNGPDFHLEHLLKTYKKYSEKMRKDTYNTIIQDLKENFTPPTFRSKRIIGFFKKALWNQDEKVRSLYNYESRLELEQGDTLSRIIDDLMELKEEGPRFEYIVDEVTRNLKEKPDGALEDGKSFTKSEKSIMYNVFTVAMEVLNKKQVSLINALEKKYKETIQNLGEN